MGNGALVHAALLSVATDLNCIFIGFYEAWSSISLQPATPRFILPAQPLAPVAADLGPAISKDCSALVGDQIFTDNL